MGYCDCNCFTQVVCAQALCVGACMNAPRPTNDSCWSVITGATSQDKYSKLNPFKISQKMGTSGPALYTMT